MSKADKATTTTTKYVESPEYLRLVYRMFRGEVRLPHPGGRIAKWPASRLLSLGGPLVDYAGKSRLASSQAMPRKISARTATERGSW